LFLIVLGMEAELLYGSQTHKKREKEHEIPGKLEMVLLIRVILPP